MSGPGPGSGSTKFLSKDLLRIRIPNTDYNIAVFTNKLKKKIPGFVGPELAPSESEVAPELTILI